VKALFALADSVEQRVQTATKQAEALTQSILARAFRGELVPTEADLARAEGRDYEPAKQLLARIREEAPTPKSPRKRAKRPTGARR
jgi:type I restriction enzyme S subunit